MHTLCVDSSICNERTKEQNQIVPPVSILYTCTILFMVPISAATGFLAYLQGCPQEPMFSLALFGSFGLRNKQAMQPTG